MSKRHYPKQAAKVRQLLNGERDSLFFNAYWREAKRLKKEFPAISISRQYRISAVPGLFRCKVTRH